MDLKELYGLGGIPFVVALTSVIKATFPGLSDRFWPAVSLAWGVVLNVVLAYILDTRYEAAVIVGLLTGLAASGLYSGSRVMAGK